MKIENYYLSYFCWKSYLKSFESYCCLMTTESLRTMRTIWNYCLNYSC